MMNVVVIIPMYEYPHSRNISASSSQTTTREKQRLLFVLVGSFSKRVWWAYQILISTAKRVFSFLPRHSLYDSYVYPYLKRSGRASKPKNDDDDEGKGFLLTYSAGKKIQISLFLSSFFFFLFLFFPFSSPINIDWIDGPASQERFIQFNFLLSRPLR